MAHIFDIDGTLVEFLTNNWLDGALDMLKDLDDQIILITRRGYGDTDKEYSIERTKETILKDLEELGVDYRILFGVSGPRVLIDDTPCRAIQRTTNQRW